MNNNRINKDELLIFLREFDLELKRKITLVAVGGTAMTLLEIKSDTKDIDFNIPLKSDYYEQNMIFSEALPGDYLKIAIKYKSKFDKIELYILNPIDIVCSKIARFSDSDIIDIKQCIKHYNITKSQIKERAMQYTHAGSDEVFYMNLETALESLF